MALPPDFLTALTQAIPSRHIRTDPADCWPYGYDNSRHHVCPDMVVFPQTAQQIQTVVQLCYQYRVPLVCRGRGTGTVGACVPLKAGLVLALEQMQAILSIDPDNRLMVVEPGVTNQAVQQAAAQHGFFWPPDPTSSAFCTVGGNLGYNSAGPRAVKYGTPRENTLGLQAITGTGTLIKTGVCTTKGVVGYDLTRLIIGSEGTLAIITQATLKLTPLPQAKCTLQAFYSDIHSATRAIAKIMAQPVTPSALEFMDGYALALIRQHHPDMRLPSAAQALLMIEVDGLTDCLQSSVQAITHAAQQPGLLNLHEAKTAAEVKQLWAVRKALSPTLRHIAPKKINEDVVVPVSRIPELITGLEQLSQRFAIPIVNFGHAGNGNIHVNLLFNPDDPAQATQARPCLDGVFDLVLKLNGTLSGEHGVGIEKRDFIDREIDPATLALMQAIKTQFDPQGILNPNKIFPLQ